MTPNWTSQTIWTGDNLNIMRGMNSDCVDLIYLDPPFNSQANYAAPIGSQAAGAEFKDTWTLSDVDTEWINLVEAKHPALRRVLLAASTSSDKSYLVYMAVRLLEMRRILKTDGSIYLHCDDSMQHWLRVLMEVIFSKSRFQNVVIWKRIGNHNDGGKFGRTADQILFYGSRIRRKEVRIPLLDKNVFSKYRHEDNRGKYRTGDLTGPGTSDGEAGYSWRNWNPTDIGRCWSVPRTGEYAAWIEKNLIPGYRSESGILARLDMLDKAGLIVFTSNGTPEIKHYLSANPGQVPPDVWTDIPPVNSQSRERTGYPTQKPLALLDRIIRASSNEGDMILDPFCGCATACIAAEALQRQWAGINISPKAAELVKLRMDRELGMLHDGIHRTDIPRRTDLGKLPRYNSEPNRQALYGQQAGNCAGCATHFKARHLEVDHIVARNKGGTDHLDNLQLLCGSCNRIKGDRGMEYLRVKLQL